MSRRQSVKPTALKKLGKLSDRLDAAKDSSEATTTEVRRARRAVENVKRDVRTQHKSDLTKRKRQRSKARSTEGGKSKAAVELGRKGGTATAKTRSRQQRSSLATKAAKIRWNRA